MSANPFFNLNSTEESTTSPLMSTMYSGEITPNLSDIHERAGVGGYNRLAEINNQFRGMDDFDKLNTMKQLGYETQTEQALRARIDPLPFDRLSAETASVIIGLEPGSDEQRAYVEWFNGSQSDEVEKAKVRTDYYDRIQQNKFKIDSALLAQAKDPIPVLKLQEKMRDLDKWYYRYPGILLDTGAETVVNAAKGGFQAGLTGMYAASRLADEAYGFVNGVNYRSGLTDEIDRTIKQIDRIEYQSLPIVKDGFVDNQLGALANVGAMIATNVLGGSRAAIAASVGLASNETMARTPNMSTDERVGLVSTLGAANAALNFLSLDRYAQSLNLGGPVANFLAQAGISALSEGTEEALQEASMELATMADEQAAGRSTEFNWSNVASAGGYGVSTSALISSLGFGGAYGRRRANQKLMQMVTSTEPEVLNIIKSKDIPETSKSDIIRGVLGEYGKAQSYVDAEAVVELGDEAVRQLAQETGIRESDIRAAAVAGQSIEANAADIFTASLKFMLSEDPSYGGIYEVGEAPTVEAMAVEDTTTESDIVEELVKPEVDYKVQAQKLMALRARKARRSMTLSNQTDLDKLGELFDLAEQADETRLLAERVANGEATPQEQERLARANISVDETADPELADSILFAGSLAKDVEDGTRDVDTLTEQEREAVRIFVSDKNQMLAYMQAMTDAYTSLQASKGQVELTSDTVALTEAEIDEIIADIPEDEIGADGLPARLAALEYAKNEKAKRLGIKLEEVATLLPKRGRRKANKLKGDVSYDAQGGVQEPGRPNQQGTRKKAKPKIARLDSQNGATTGDSVKPVVSLKVKHKIKQAVKAFVGDEKKTIHGLMRATPESQSVSAIKINAEFIKSFLKDTQQIEQINELDSLNIIKRIRNDLTQSLDGNEQQVSRAMQLFKSMVVNFAERNNLSPEQYVSSFYVQTVLNKSVTGPIIDSVTAVNNVIANEKFKELGKVARRLESSGVVIDNSTTQDRLASRITTPDGMTTPTGERVQFIWSDGFLNDIDSNFITIIPEVISHGIRSKRRNRVSYSTPQFRVQLAEFSKGVYTVLGVTEISQQVSADVPIESVASMMKRSTLGGVYRAALESFLTDIVSSGQQLGDLNSYEKITRNAIDVSNALSQRVQQVKEVTDNLTNNLSPQFLKTLGVPESVDIKNFVDDLLQRAESFKFFYTNPDIVDFLNNLVTRNQIFNAGNTNPDGLTYGDWLSAAQRGDYISTVRAIKKINDGTEKQPFSSFVNFTNGYDRNIVANGVRQYYETAFANALPRTWLKARRDAAITAFKAGYESSGFSGYVTAFSEYSAFMLNTDPRFFAEVAFRSDNLGDAHGRYTYSGSIISIDRSMVARAATGDTEIFNTMAHEFNHHIMFKVASAGYSLDKTSLGFFYDTIFNKTTGGKAWEPGFGLMKLFTNPETDAADALQAYLNTPAEQTAYLAQSVFAEKADMPEIIDTIATEYGVAPAAEIFNDPTLRNDFSVIQDLFTSLTQPELIQLLADNTQYQKTLGSITKLYPRSYTIQLNAGKFNYSTLPHEFFHMWIDLAKTDAPDLWTELDRSVGGALSRTAQTEGEIASKIAAEEKIVRQFEYYLLGGKAPSRYLRNTFDAYSRWLTGVYADKIEKDVTVPNDLKRVFDRFVASENSIRVAEQYAGIEKTFLNTLTPDNKRARQVAQTEEKARLSARDKQRQKIIGSYMKLSGEFDKLKSTARNTVGLDPVNTLAEEAVTAGFVSRRRLYDEKIPASEVVTKDNEDAFLEMLVDWRNDNNSDVESIEEAITLIRQKGLVSDQVSAEVERLKTERMAAVMDSLGGTDLMSDEAVFSSDLTVYLDKLQEAVEGEKQNLGNRMLSAALAASARTKADTDFGKLTLNDAKKYRQYVSDMRKNLIAYRNAANKKDYESASKFLTLSRMAQHKINNSISLRDRITSVKNDWGKHAPKRLGKIRLEHGDNIVAILKTYRINERILPSTLQPWTELKLPMADDNGLTDMLMALQDVVPADIKRLEVRSEVKSIEDLTVDEFNRVVDAITVIEKAGTISLNVLKQANYESAKEMRDDMLRTLDTVKTREALDYNKTKGVKGLIRRFIDKAGTYGILNEFIFSKADGFTDISGGGFGPHRSMFFAAREATAAAERMMELYQGKLDVILKDFYSSFTKHFDANNYGELPQKIAMQHGQKQWTPELVLMTSLNTGNVGNLQSLTEGYELSTDQVQDLMNNFTADELKMIQGIWDVLEELYQPSVDTWYDISGLRPKRVDAVPMEYEHGSVRGGYFPLVFESTNGRGSEFFKVLFPSIDSNPSYMQDRAKSRSKPPRLDTSVLANHIYSATRLISSGRVMDTISKVVSDRAWSQKFISKFGRDRYNDVLQHFGMMANPHSIYSAQSTFGGSILDWVRSNAITATLGFRFWSGLKQRTDLLNVANVMVQQNRTSAGESFKTLAKSAYSLGVRGNIGLLDLASYNQNGEIIVNGRVTKFEDLDNIQVVYLKSDSARARDQRVDMNLRHQLKAMVGEKRTIRMFGRDISWDDVHNSFFAWLRMNDRAAYSTAWLAQYGLAKEGKGSFDITGMKEDQIERLAVRDADAVATTMASSAIADQIAGQRDPTLRLFSSFISGQVRRGSRMWQAVEAFRAGQITAKHMLGNLAVEVYGRVITTTVAAYAARSLWNKYITGEDDEEEVNVKDLAKGLLTEPVWAMMDSVPIASSIAGYARGYGRTVISTPGQQALDTAVYDFKRGYKKLQEGDMWEALKSTTYGASYFVRIPVRAPAKDMGKLLEYLGFMEENNGRR